MDFFSSAPGALGNNQPPDVDPFAEAIANRFGSGNSNPILTARLTAGILPISPSSSKTHAGATSINVNNPNQSQSMAIRMPASLSLKKPPSAAPISTSASSSTSTTTAPPPHRFQSVTPAELPTRIFNDPGSLVLDIRPHAVYASGRLPNSVSLSVPSTLLKRPLFGLDRLAAMLHSASARARFSDWRSSTQIIVYDVDATSIPEGSNILGLLRKFTADGFQGPLLWLHGGFQAIWKENRALIVTTPPTPEVDDDAITGVSSTAVARSKLGSGAPQTMSLRTDRLPTDAFSTVSTMSTGTGPIGMERTQARAFNPFYDSVRQNVELSQGITERIPLKLPARVRRRAQELPFPWLRSLARRADVIPHNEDSESEGSDVDPSDIDASNIEEGKEALAMQFYRIELAEQRRMMNVMEYHTKESNLQPSFTFRLGAAGTSDLGSSAASSAQPRAFPFSITAGVEKGAKNRYRHIWPFEHARVRLRADKKGEDDYVNASYIQPLGTRKRYIATQGPLPATYVDFWSMCWEQNVNTIVMLTREMENNQIKCGSYWTDQVYGPLRLELISEDPYLASSPSVGTGGTSSHNAHQQQGFFFMPPPSLERTYSRTTPGAFRDPRQAREEHKRRRERENQIITRKFKLTHTAYPRAEPRHVTQLQFLGWQDMNVPDDARGVLSLVEMAAKAQEEGEKEAKRQRAQLRRRKREEEWRLRGGYKKDAAALEQMEEDSDVDDGSSSEEEGKEESREEDGRRFDPDTGVVRKHGPVLLHCSAGVGRTGGFIVVDAVLDGIRREMLKGHRVQAAAKAPKAPAQGRHDSNSTVGSSNSLQASSQPLQGETHMDVDGTSSASLQPPHPEKPPHRRASVSAGRDIVHVPVIATGRSSSSPAQDEDDKMDVDLPAQGPASARPQLHQQQTVIPLTPAEKQVVAKQDREEKKRQQDLSTQRWAENVDRATSFVADTVAAAPKGHPQQLQQQQSSDVDPDIKMDSTPLPQPPLQLADPSAAMTRNDSEASKGSGSSGASSGTVLAGSESQPSRSETPLASASATSSQTATMPSTPGSNRDDSTLSSSDEPSTESAVKSRRSSEAVPNASRPELTTARSTMSPNMLAMKIDAGSTKGSSSSSASSSKSVHAGGSASKTLAHPLSLLTPHPGHKLQELAQRHGSLISLSSAASSSSVSVPENPPSSTAPLDSVTGNLNSSTTSLSGSGLDQEGGKRDVVVQDQEVVKSRAKIYQQPLLSGFKLKLPGGGESSVPATSSTAATAATASSPESTTPIKGGNFPTTTFKHPLSRQIIPHGQSATASTTVSPAVSGRVSPAFSARLREKAPVLSSGLPFPAANMGTGATGNNSVASSALPTAYYSAPMSLSSAESIPSTTAIEGSGDGGHGLPAPGGSSVSGYDQPPTSSVTSGNGSSSSGISSIIKKSGLMGLGGSGLGFGPLMADQSRSRMTSHSALASVNGDHLTNTTSNNNNQSIASNESANSHIDYKEPRKQDMDQSPPLLTIYDDPIMEVVLDMREQRMSLVQSLRQYVFVHAAIIEGALQISDELKAKGIPVEFAAPKKAPKTGADSDTKKKSSSKHDHLDASSSPYFPPVPSANAATTAAVTSDAAAAAAVGDNMLVDIVSPRPYRVRGTSSNSDAPSVVSAVSFGSGSGSGSSPAKRSASPTELMKENKMGELSLSKRPSIKRKQRESEMGPTPFMRSSPPPPPPPLPQ